MKIEKINNNKFIINKTGEMKAPAIIYCNEQMISNILSDKSLNQIINVASLPGIVNYAIAMPDIHQGYGFPIGGVAAFDSEQGIICPGGVGFDINCGVRLIKTNLTKDEIEKNITKLSYLLFSSIPSGLGSQSNKKFEKKEMKNFIDDGIKWMIKRGYADNIDSDSIEDNGALSQTDSEIISEEAFNRGKDELGTLGSGNHFLEIDYISQIFDEKIAKEFGLFPNQIVIWIHTGSRGFGHQIAKEYIDKMKKKMIKNGIKLKDPELVYLPISDPISQQYITAMNCAANYAYCNRQLITFHIRESFQKIFNKTWDKLGLFILYDVCHNIAKYENHIVDNKIKKLLIHRKGATRAFPSQNKNIPMKFYNIGQPVLIPGDMERGSYILVGTNQCMIETFGSVSHGAGRVMSRNQAKKSFDFSSIQKELSSKNIFLIAKDNTLILEEAPLAYKNIDNIINILILNNLSKIVAKSLPISVVKG